MVISNSALEQKTFHETLIAYILLFVSTSLPETIVFRENEMKCLRPETGRVATFWKKQYHHDR